ncbi:MAG: hypothetical protein IPP83_15815 [Flavobacteriales bacterium]|nr:hypothetical protein [Flavobacteriales bacterium]
MKAIRTYPIVLIAVLALASCGKGELDPDTLTNNPFDPDYDGPAVFALDTTYLEVVSIPGATLLNQAIVFHAKAELFLSDASYSVKVVDRISGMSFTLDPNPANSDRFKYVRSEPVIGAPVCLELRLFNNQSAARAEQICATLQ